jgi:hypothetical protein
MFVRRTLTPPALSESFQPVLVEPRAGHSDRDVVALLERAGAREVDVLAPGFISALLRSSAFQALAEIADVHPKPVKLVRNRAR